MYSAMTTRACRSPAMSIRSVHSARAVRTNDQAEVATRIDGSDVPGAQPAVGRERCSAAFVVVVAAAPDGQLPEVLRDEARDSCLVLKPVLQGHGGTRLVRHRRSRDWRLDNGPVAAFRRRAGAHRAPRLMTKDR